jgi:hypothetical protein
MNLPNKVVEEAIGEFGFDEGFEPMIRSDVRLVRLVSGTSAASEDANDATIPANNGCSGITSLRELRVVVRFGIVAQDEDFEGVARDPIFVVGANKGFEAVHATQGGAGASPILEAKQGFDPVHVDILRVVKLGLGNDALDLKEAIHWITGVGLVGRLRKQGVAEVGRR